MTKSVQNEKGSDQVKESFGKLPTGEEVDIYTLKNTNGMVVKITTYGGTVTEISVPDRQGNYKNVTLGFDNLKQYTEQSPYFGCIVGRVANRIAKGSFSLNGTEYKLAINNGPNTLHGGLKGFDKKVWQAEPFSSADGAGLKLTSTSPDMEEGYPGTVKTEVQYLLTEKNELRISYKAETDKDTPINLTNHAYFNLAGEGNGDVLGHELTIHASKYTPVDETLIPTGEIAPLKETALDFSKPHAIGERIAKVEGGYDHNFIIDGIPGELRLAVKVREPKSGRVMEMWTTEPGVQFYSGNFLDGKAKGPNGPYNKHFGFCLEAQHFPDSVNHPNFPSVVYKPGQTYTQVTVYKFKTE